MELIKEESSEFTYVSKRSSSEQVTMPKTSLVYLWYTTQCVNTCSQWTVHCSWSIADVLREKGVLPSYSMVFLIKWLESIYTYCTDGRPKKNFFIYLFSYLFIAVLREAFYCCSLVSLYSMMKHVYPDGDVLPKLPRPHAPIWISQYGRFWTAILDTNWWNVFWKKVFFFQHNSRGLLNPCQCSQKQFFPL